jgi:hypothetical protein
MNEWVSLFSFVIVCCRLSKNSFFFFDSAQDDEADDTIASEANTRAPYSLRSRIRVEDDDESEESCEVDYALSQQCSNLQRFHF